MGEGCVWDEVSWIGRGYWLFARSQGEYRRERGGGHFAALAPSTTLRVVALPRKWGRNQKTNRLRNPR